MSNDELELFESYIYWPKEWFDAVVIYCRESQVTPLDLIEAHKTRKQMVIGFTEWKDKHYEENSYMGETLYYLVTESTVKTDVPDFLTIDQLYTLYLKYKNNHQ